MKGILFLNVLRAGNPVNTVVIWGVDTLNQGRCTPGGGTSGASSDDVEVSRRKEFKGLTRRVYDLMSLWEGVSQRYPECFPREVVFR